MFESIVEDTRVALRALGRAPGFTIIVVLTLAVGIGVNTAIFSVVDAVLLSPLPYPDADRVVTIGLDRPELGRGEFGFADAGAIRGRVADSLRGGGLAGAVVMVFGTSRQAVTDEDGRFWLFDVPVGSHYLGFAHDEIDAWGLGSGYIPVDVREGVSAEVELAVPRFADVALALCLRGGVDAETVVVGHVLGPDREPWPGQAIRLVFERPAPGGGSLVDLRLNTDERGRFAVCSVPGGETVTLRADLGDGWEDVTESIAGEGEVTYREILISR